MKLEQKQIVLPAIALIAGAVGFGAAQNPQQPQQPTATQRLETLEKEVETLKADFERLNKLAGSAGETRKLIESVVNWASAQGAAAERLERALADSEQKGFTKGINWESREALLAGMNDFASTVQKDVPKLPAEQTKGAAQR